MIAEITLLPDGTLDVAAADGFDLPVILSGPPAEILSTPDRPPSPEQIRAAERLARQAAEAIGLQPGVPRRFTAADRAAWLATVEGADELFRSLFGEELWRDRKLKLAKERLRVERPPAAVPGEW